MQRAPPPLDLTAAAALPSCFAVPRDPIRSLEWAPDAGVAYEPDQKPAAALEQPQQQVALTADASSGAAAAGAAADPADATSAILAKRRAHLGPNMTLFFQVTLP